MIEVQKAQELDVVELTEDLPQYGLTKGSRGTVVEVFDQPEQAYMVEFSDNSETGSKIADWVLPNQIESLDALAAPLFEQGFSSLKKGQVLEAAEQFRKAVKLRPSCIRNLHNHFAERFAIGEDWEQLIVGMNFLIEIDPTYELARQNLAIAFLNCGVQKAREGEFEASLNHFLRAVEMDASADVVELIRQNITSSHMALGVQAHKNGQYELAIRHMQSAYMFNSNSLTRRNLGMAYLVWADECLATGDFEKARMHYFFAEETGLRTTEGLNNRAVTHVHLDQVDEAIRALETALALDAGNEVARANLSLLRVNRPFLKQELFQCLRTEPMTSEFFPFPQASAAPLVAA